jgi:hypothetical protein
MNWDLIMILMIAYFPSVSMFDQLLEGFRERLYDSSIRVDLNGNRIDSSCTDLAGRPQNASVVNKHGKIIRGVV